MAETLYVTVPPTTAVVIDGCPIIPGGSKTRRVPPLLEVEPTAFVITTLYSPSSENVVLVFE
jgi:hypothetical protein